jgi:hypothetical protein
MKDEIPIREAARRSGKSRQWLMKMVQAGRLRGRRLQSPRGPYWMVRHVNGEVVIDDPPKRKA